MDVQKAKNQYSDLDGEEENVVLVPKKRGRPAKPSTGEKVEKSGRGRGRPPKSGEPAAIRKREGGNVGNGDTGSDGEGKPLKRGRPLKLGKLKIQHTIAPTGKGRGRPKLENGGGGSTAAKNKQKGTPKKLGRPRKEASDDDDRSGDVSDDSKDEDDDEEERHPVGRPSTGAVNLNIGRTGRGQGRPKKNKGNDARKRNVDENTESDGEEQATPKKRGRPPTGAVAVKAAPSGKPRGRPKKANTDDDEEEEDVIDLDKSAKSENRNDDSLDDEDEKHEDEDNDDDV